KLVLPTPPEADRPQAGATWLTVLLPLLSSVGMAAYMITFGRPVLILVGVLFVLVAIGTTIAMRFQVRSASRKSNRRQRLRYRHRLAGVRDAARATTELQRLRAALVHPDPERLWAMATTRQRLWERRRTDPDFLKVRVGTGEAELAGGLQFGRIDP